MRRWNGWGEKSISVRLPEEGRRLLLRAIGAGKPQRDCSLASVLKRIPETRLPHHPLVTTDPQQRLDHAHGQSLPDWIALRGGRLKRYPIGVAYPSSREDIFDLFKFARHHQLAIIPYGGGTSVVGHLHIPDIQRPVLSISLERMHHMVAFNPADRLAEFEPGIRGIELENKLATEGYTLGHYPQSFEFSTLGGWVATRSCGQQAARYGRIDEMFAGGELVAPHGRLSMKPFPASAAGPDLRQVVLGSEGRFGIFTRIAVTVTRIPEVDDIYGVFFASWETAESAIRTLAGSGIPFSMIRLSNANETETQLALSGAPQKTKLLKQYLRIRGIQSPGCCLCLLGFTGSRRQTRAARAEAFDLLHRHTAVSTGQLIGRMWKAHRFKSPYLRNTLWDLGYAVDTVETAVAWHQVTAAMAAIEKAISDSLAVYDESGLVFSHLSHVYPTGSSLYTTVVFRLADSPDETLSRWRRMKGAASTAVVQSGGTISHQHGVGVDHRPYLGPEKGAMGIGLLKDLCDYFDPQQQMNPSKLVI